MESLELFRFGSFPISTTEIFYESKHAFALVNIKPIVPGHVLVVSRRRVDRFSLLHPLEVADLWNTAQVVGKVIEKQYTADSLTFAIQDGRAAGQTVPHVHIHILPRIFEDFERNDMVYTEVG